MTQVFLDYAKYYDALYKDKDYKTEVDFIVSEIRKYAPHAKSILNIGCGTGRHDQFLSEYGFNITGIDLSAQMVEIAKARNTSSSFQYLHGDGRNIFLDQKFDVVISLFHVLSYQTSNEDVINFLKSASRNLNENGICIMDFWYGPAVLNLKPERRTKSFSTSEMTVVRHSYTTMNYVSNVATVNFDVEIKDLEKDAVQSLHEKHPMRYFFSPEVTLLSELSGLKEIHHAEWMKPDEKPSENSWAAYSIFKK